MLQEGGCLPERKNKGGRPAAAFTKEARDEIIRCLRKGMPVKHALAKARVSENTWGKWLDAGRKDLECTPEGEPLSEHAIFLEDVRIAKADNVEGVIDKMNSALERDGKNWAAVMTAQERLNHDDFGQRQQVTVQQDTTVKVVIERRGGDEWRLGKKADDVIDEEVVEQKLIGGSFE